MPSGTLTPVSSHAFSRPVSAFAGSTFAASTDKLPIVATDEIDNEDTEKGASGPESLERPVYVTSAVFAGLGICLLIVLAFGLMTSKLLVETLTDGLKVRFALAAALPFLVLVGLFFVLTIFTNLFSILGPIGGIQSNSRYYSGKKPNLRRAYAEGFEPPHVTIQMPVYKEGLEGVIMPTVKSLKMAISHYESHGGNDSV
jgi:hypothetical protein